MDQDPNRYKHGLGLAVLIRGFCLVSIVLGTSCVDAQQSQTEIPEATAISSAREWIEKLSGESALDTPNVEYLRSSETNAAIVFVQIGEMLVKLDAYDGQLVGYADGRRARELSDGLYRADPDVYNTDILCSQRAQSIMELIGLKAGGYVQSKLKRFDEEISTLQSNRGLCRVSFYPGPFGRNPQGVGNSIDMEFDVQDGAVVSLRLVRGWTYQDALTLGYTVDQARDEAFEYYESMVGQPDAPDSPEEFMIVWGDHHTKLKGVYTGTLPVAPVTSFARQSLAW